MKTNFDQNLVLAQMQRLNQMAKSGANQPVNNTPQTNQVESKAFGDLLNNAVSTVNQYQQQAAQATT